MKRYFITLFFAFALWGCLPAADYILGISADGTKDKFVLSNTQNATVSFNSDSVASLHIKSFDGKPFGHYRSIVFHPSEEDVKDAGVDNITTDGFAVYPNPVSEYITIYGASESTVVNVLNMNGQTVLQSNGAMVDVSALTAGEYVLVVDGNSVKFIKK